MPNGTTDDVRFELHGGPGIRTNMLSLNHLLARHPTNPEQTPQEEIL
jgi:hypothetical protein